MRTFRFATTLLLTLSLGGAGMVVAPRAARGECQPRYACMSAPNWACITGGVEFNKCNEGPGSDPFDIVCTLI